jgi:aryl-alcohol dehydrogenase-like predicted oxidoreductase
VVTGRWTAEGSGRFVARHEEAAANGFYRAAQGALLSSLGIGTYLGPVDDATDAAYAASIASAVRGGINVIDTAINYRHMRSEKATGDALRALFAAGAARREELLVCTKAAFLTPGAMPSGVLREQDVVGGTHSMAPDFLADQIDRSRANLGLETIDVFYLHNPETQLKHVPREEFDHRLLAAFARLESLAREGRIAWYGLATWSCFRLKAGHPERLPLQRVIELARDAGGEEPHLRFLQLPINLGMPEAFTLPHATLNGDQVNVLEVAVRAGLTVVASASLMQARLAADLPAELRARWPEAQSDAQFALQFARSTPGVTTALAGMSRAGHVAENLGLAGFAPAPPESYLGLFQREG